LVEDERIELTVILPAYNEGEAVADAVRQYLSVLPGCCEGFEIIVVNDGSTDDTGAFAERLARDHLGVRVVNHETNRGQVAALLRGMEEACGRVVTHNGIDLPFHPRETGRMLESIRRGADVVVVERASRQAYGLFRKVVSWCNIALIKLLFRSPFVDHNFVQAYRRPVLKAVTVESRGVSTVTPEIILKAFEAGFRVERMSADYAARNSGKSSVSLGRIAHTTLELFQLWRIMRRWRARSKRCFEEAKLQRKSV
jgi:undecaprenyl-phosphate 4-deoxy-4-formamido-L-arabinose transferase